MKLRRRRKGDIDVMAYEELPHKRAFTRTHWNSSAGLRALGRAVRLLVLLTRASLVGVAAGAIAGRKAFKKELQTDGS